MLGAEQERWLFEQLAAAKATWTVLGQQVPTFARDMVGREPAGPLLDGQVGRLHRRAPAASTQRLRDTKAPNPSSCRAMCTCTTAPT